MANTYGRLADRPYQSTNLFAEVDIARPVAEVWDHVLDLGQWMTKNRLDTLDGTPGQVGHFGRATPHGADQTRATANYHLFGITHAVPHKYLGLEALSEKGGSYGAADAWMTFDSVLLVDLGRATRVILVVVDVHLQQGEKNAIQKEFEAHGPARAQSYLGNLKRIAEGDV